MNADIPASILIVEDEPDVRDILDYLFSSAGYTVHTATSAGTARTAIRRYPTDLVVLDVELPDESGLVLCREIRPQGVPVIMVSSHDRDDEVVAGLETGADDYVRKPFNNRELLLRVRRLLESAPSPGAARSGLRVAIADLVIDREAARVWRGGTEINLTPTEWNTLDFLVVNRGRTLTVEEILEGVWHVDRWEGGAAMVKVTIRRLRHKIERNPRQPEIVLNRWGRGYLIE
jgi:two-component system, OmpR family, response regulator VicR